MPRRSSAKTVQTYEPIDPPPEQKRFGLRRTSAKPKSSKLPPKTKSQASFTQNYPEWLGSTSGSSVVVIGNSSGEEEEEEYKETRPTKRRRKDERERDQPTYTQAIRSAPTRKARKSKLDEDGFEVLPDGLDDGGVDTPMDRVRKGLQQRAVGELQCTDWTANNDSGYESKMGPEIANSSSQLEDESPAVIATPRAFRTPHKVRLTEIPSSQSPASARLSTQRSQRYKDVERSPLKERSVNVRFPVKLGSSLKSQLRHQPSQLPQEDALPTVSPVKDQDTQALEPCADQTGTEAQQSKRTLKRVATVQDSQYEDLDLSTPDAEVETDIGAEETADDDDYDENAEDYQEDDEYELQPTYDPAYSALDRDAARFGQTQTQGYPLEPHISNSTCSDDELLTEDEAEDELHMTGAAHQLSQDLDDAMEEEEQEQEEQEVEEVDAGADAVPSSQPAETRHTLATEQQHTTRLPSPDHALPAPADIPPHSDSLPSSPPPPLRPSQISTVVPTQTQRSPRGRPSSRSKNEREPLTFDSPQKLRSQKYHSPQKPAAGHSWPEMMSSSPFPLPPWSSPERHQGLQTQRAGRGVLFGEGDVLESLVDFSLPPPPPMSSSRVGTQDGGSSSPAL